MRLFKSTAFAPALLALGLTAGAASWAQNVNVSAADTVRSVVAAQKGKRVTLRLRSGQELSGTVRESTEKLVVLEALAGREFFDAVVPVEMVEAVLIRTKN